MSGTCCISIDGVLSRPSSAPLVQRQAYPFSREFYDVLRSRYRIVFLMNTTVAQFDRTKWWLDGQGFAGYDSLLPAAEDAFDDVDAAYRQITTLKSNRVDVSLCISTDALIITMAAQQGITGMLWCPARPAMMRSDLRPRKVREWASVEDEIVNQKANADADLR